MKFDLILVDAPWSFKTWSPKGQGRAPKYPTMSLEDIVALPVNTIAAKNCVLFLWTLGWIPPQTIADLLVSWDFTYKTLAFDWWKVTAEDLPRGAKGYYTRASSEQCILATRGKMTVLPKNRPIQAILEQPSQHSKKPLEAYDKIERMYPNARKIELFSREPRRDWTALGNEIDGMDISKAIKKLAEI